MADTPAATPSGDSGSGSAQDSYASEFSHPVGAEDAKVWDKHFGKEAPWPKDEKGKAKASSSGGSESKSRDSSKKSESGESDSKPEKGSSSESSKDSKSKPDEKPKPEKKPDRASAQPPASDKDSTAETGGKTAEPNKDEDSDAADHKALLAKAKAEKDPRQARKLYRQALEKAFDEVPDEFNDAKWHAARVKRESDRTEIEAARAKLDTDRAEQDKAHAAKVQDAVTKLQPAILVMRKLNDAGLGDKLTMPMVEHAVEVMRELRRLEEGDFTGLGALVAKASRMDPEEAMKNFVRGVKASPASRAMRQAAEDAKREAAETRAEIAQLKRQLQERDQQQVKQQDEATKKQAREKARADYRAGLETELEGHPVTKLSRGVERVMAYLIKTADPKTRTAKYSPAAVADRIVAYEKKRAAEVARLEGGNDASDTPSEVRARTPSRRDTAETGINDDSPEARFDRIFTKHTQRAAGGRR